MKKTDIKFFAGQMLFIIGLVILSIGARWSFFIGLALVMISVSFSLRRNPQPWSLAARTISVLLWIGSVVFLTWFSSFGAEKPPLAALVGVGLAGSIEEFRSWRKSRNLT